MTSACGGGEASAIAAMIPQRPQAGRPSNRAAFLTPHDNDR
jgi:hypothetical protein